MARTQPSRAFLKRDRHRKLLTLHFALFLGGMVGCFFANRMLTPDVFWMQWVALGWGVLLALHGGWFATSTLATMGGKRD